MGHVACVGERRRDLGVDGQIKLKWVRNSMLGHGLELLDSRQPLIFTVMTLLTLRNVGNFVLV